MFNDYFTKYAIPQFVEVDGQRAPAARGHAKDSHAANKMTFSDHFKMAVPGPARQR